MPNLPTGPGLAPVVVQSARATIWRMKFKCSRCYTVRTVKAAVNEETMEVLEAFDDKGCHACGSDGGDFTGDGEDTGDEV